MGEKVYFATTDVTGNPGASSGFNGFPFPIPCRGDSVGIISPEANIGYGIWGDLGYVEGKPDPTPDELLYKVWDGSTYYEKTQTQTVQPDDWSGGWGPDTDTSTFPTRVMKFRHPSNSTAYISNVVGPGTEYLKFPIAKAMELFWRIKQLTATVSGTAVMLLRDYNLTLTLDALFDEGTANDDSTELDLLQRYGTNLGWTAPPYARIATTSNASDGDGPIYTKITDGAGTFVTPNDPANAYIVASFGVGVTGQPVAPACRVESDPDHVYIHVRHLLGFGGDIRDEGATWYRPGAGFGTGNYTAEKVSFTEHFTGISNMVINGVVVDAGSFTLTILGESFTIPCLYGSNYLQYGETPATVAVSGTVDLKPKAYWSYANSKGWPVYDKSSGSRLCDPLS